MENKIEPETVEKIIRCAIAVLTAVLGFLTGMGSATACQIINHL